MSKTRKFSVGLGASGQGVRGENDNRYHLKSFNDNRRKFGRPIMDAAWQTFDASQMDSAGAFFIGELERLDPVIHAPLAAITWVRDLDIRPDVQIGDTSSSYIVQSFGNSGGAGGAINWANNQTTAIARTTVDLAHIVNPLNLVNYEVGYSIPELLSAQQLGRPIDIQLLMAMTLSHQMQADQVAYIGDPTVTLGSGAPLTGLTNSSNVTNLSSAAPSGTGGSALWVNKTPQQVLTDVDTLIMSVWQSSGYAVAPSKLLLSPGLFGYAVATPVTIGTTGTAKNILSYIAENNILTAQTDQRLDIQPVKWLAKTARGSATDRIMAYTQKQEYVRFPLVPLQALPPQFRGVNVAVPYFGRFGVVETVYPETIGYMDGAA